MEQQPTEFRHGARRERHEVAEAARQIRGRSYSDLEDVMARDPEWNIAFSVGDYLAGGLTGIAIAFAVRAAVSPGADMVLAMLLGMVIGMIVHVAIAAALSPLLGFFHLMVPGSLIGMYGGMAFAMRDSMQHPAGSPGQTCWVGLVFGMAVVGLVRLYDRALKPRRASTGEGGD